MSNMSYLIGAHSVTVFFNKKPYTISNQAHNYNSVIDAIQANDYDALELALELRTTIVNTMNAQANNVTIVGNRIMYNDYEITGLISTRIFEMIKNGLNIQPMIRFCENLMRNPSNRAVNELFGFMDACSLPITEDGAFLAYKRIRSDYKDVYTGTIDNSVGATPSVPRNQVDEDSNRTCSHGLHVCSYDYLAHYLGDRIVVCKIFPQNVVAVPSDYNNAKMRVCEYTVVDELPVSDYQPTTRIKDWYTDDYTSSDVDDEDDWLPEDESDDEEIYIEETDDDNEQPESNLTPLEALMDQLDGDEEEFERLHNDLTRVISGSSKLTLENVARWFEVDESVLEAYSRTLSAPRYTVMEYNDALDRWQEYSMCTSRQEARHAKWKLRDLGIDSYIYDNVKLGKIT